MANSWILKWGLTQLETNFALWAMSDIFRYFGYVTFSLVGTFCIVLPVTPYESSFSSFTWSFCANFVSVALVVCPCWVSCFLAASLFLFSSEVWPLNSWGSVNVLERVVPWCRWGEKDVIPREKKKLSRAKEENEKKSNATTVELVSTERSDKCQWLMRK